jgi:peptidoglycan hydrolase CwlO-like protein
VNRAILFYMHAGAVMESRDQLQELVYEYSEKIASLEDEIQCLKENIEVIA